MVVPGLGTFVKDVPNTGTHVPDTIQIVPDEPDHPVLSRGYIEMVVAAHDSLPHGMSVVIDPTRKAIHRIRHADAISADAIDEFRRALNRHDPEAKLPPPVVKIESRDQYRWIELGRRLLEISPSAFERACANIERIIAGVEADRELGLSSDE